MHNCGFRIICEHHEHHSSNHQENGKTNYVNKIDKALLGWKTSQADGSWNKGALTTSLCLFVEDFCKRRGLENSENEMYSRIATCHVFIPEPFCFCAIWFLLKTFIFTANQASGSRALNYFMSSLYHNDMFIRSEVAKGINSAGRHFLMAFSRLSLLCYRMSQARFTYVPKVHMMWHLVDNMCTQACHHQWVLNPIAESCAVDEDLIGRFCLLTRKVSIRKRCQRALERYLTQTWMVWQRPENCNAS